MPRFSLKVGCITMIVKHLVRRPSGAFYFRLGIPQDLREFYKGKREHNHSLKTQNESEAVKRCVAYTLKYEQEFKQLRSTGERARAAALLKSYDLAPIPIADQPRFEDLDNPGNPYNQLMEDLAFKYGGAGEYLPADPHEDRAVDILRGEEKLTLAEVEADALKAVVVKAGREIALRRKRSDIARHFSSFTKLLPTTRLDLIRRKQVQDAVDQMLDDGSQTGTVKKRLGAVRLCVEGAIATYELDIKNPFDRVTIRGLGSDVKKKPTFSSEQLIQVKRFILDKSELTTAQVLGLLVDTGARSGEIGGILLADICLDDSVPHIVCREADNRDIKSAAGLRRVPLAGLSLEIAKKVTAGASKGQLYAFPQWNKTGEFDHTTCNGAVNALLRSCFKGFTTHCFRHTLADRLKDANVRPDIINGFCGWADKGMQSHYGQSDKLELLLEGINAALAREKS